LRRKFDAAGQDPERLAPTEQVTFACIEAWAARSSLHPAVLRSKNGGPLFIEQASSEADAAAGRGYVVFADELGLSLQVRNGSITM
jgi:hypothetical protein